MATTSGTYNFENTQSDQIVAEAFERCGILPDVITGQQVQSAIRSGNLILASWINRGLNLWTVKQEMLNLIPGQATYTLPDETSDILEADIRTSTRNLGGTASSSAGGNAANAFDGNSSTACTQTAPNGNISYNYGNNVQYAIAMVGIQSNATLTYTLTFEYSLDGSTWNTAYTPAAQVYNLGVNVWFVIPVPTNAQYFRVRETGGATLNIQELYFNTALQDIPITRISRAEYISYPQKNQQGRPTSFYVNRQISPTVTLWPVPTALYNNMFYTRVKQMQDIGTLANIPEIPQRFFDALSAGLAHRIAIKFAPDKVPLLAEEAQLAFDKAAEEDVERVPLRVFGDYMQGWGYV